MIRDITSLMAPQRPELLYDHFIRKERFHVKSADRDRAVPLLPWSTINHLIETDALPAGRFKLFRSNNLVYPALYRKADDKSLRPGVFADLLRQGSSLVMDNIDRWVPPIGRLNAAIERDLSCKVWSNAYVSFGEGSAFQEHYDLHDVLILQVHGRKRWRSYGVAVAHPIDHAVPADQGSQAVVWEDTLEAGDLLYLPRGEVHMADLEDGNSVHLTIGLLSRRGLDFAEGIIKLAAKDLLFRQDVPVAAGMAALRDHETALKTALHALIDRMDLTRYVDNDNRSRHLYPLVNLGAGCLCHADTLVESALRRRIPMETEVEGERELSLGGERFRLSASARRVLDFLTRHGECRFAAIVSALAPQLDEPHVRDAVRELAEQGLVGLGA
jgi:hypothetical protein